MKSVLTVFLACCASVLFCQNNFPASWQGKWAGTLEIINPKGKVQELPMELHILPVDSSDKYTWTIIYGEDKEAGTGPYELIPVDTTKGLYWLDEKNSIRIEAYLLDNKLYQWFEVQGTLIFSTTEKVGDELIWELVSGDAAPVSVTGGQVVEGEEIPPVKTYPAKVLQKARLSKKEIKKGRNKRRNKQD